MDDKKTLFSRIQSCDFILEETALFLDTHPTCKEALDFFKKHLDMRNTAMSEYSEKYGMLTHGEYANQKTWEWVDGPWPWEYKEE